MTLPSKQTNNKIKNVGKMKKINGELISLSLPVIVREKLPAARSLVITAILPFPTEHTIETRQMYYVRGGRCFTPLGTKTSYDNIKNHTKSK